MRQVKGRRNTSVVAGLAALLLVTSLVVVVSAFVSRQQAVAAGGPSGAITEFLDPVNGSDPVGIAAGPDGNLWIAESNDFPLSPTDPNDPAQHIKVEKMTPSGQQFTGFGVFAGGCCADPLGIVQGSDGNMWFTESTTGANAIGRIPPGGGPGSATEFSGPTRLSPNSLPTAITAGPPGTLWFTEAAVSNSVTATGTPGPHGPATIGRITTGGTVTEFPTGHPFNAPYGITMGPDSNIWYTEQSDVTGTTSTVSVMNPSTGAVITSIPVALSGVGLSGLTKGSDGNIWFTEMRGSGQEALGRIVPSGFTSSFNRTVADTGTGVNSITSAPDGFLYFTEPQRNSIGRIDPRTVTSMGMSVTEHFQVITLGAFSFGAPPTGITTGPDNSIYFTEGSGKSEGGPSPIHNVGKLKLGALVNLSSGSFDFGAKATGSTSTPQTLAITSKGADNVAFTGFPLTGANPGDFKISSNGCQTKTLKNSDPADPTCTLNVSFAPTGVGPRSATLTLNDSAGSQAITLTGTGFISSGAATFNPTSLSFGNQLVGTPGTSSRLTLTNTGNAALTVASVAITGTNPADFSKGADSCSSATVPVNGSCTVTVVFAPTDVGARTANLTFNDSAQNSPQDIPLSGQGISSSPPPPPPPTASGGYWLTAKDGGIFNYGNAKFFGSAGAIRLNKPIVGMAATPSGNGYWLVASDGGIFNYGDAQFLGSAGGINLNKPIVGMASTPTGNGYWLVATDGGIFNYGDAKFFGSAGAIRLNKPIAGMASTPAGGGYWLVATDGGIFNYGDAGFFGSAGSIRLNQPIVGMAATATGGGYWFVATDGGIFNYGDAGFFGSAGAIRLNQPIAGMAAAPAGNGYWLVATDGGIFNYGGAGFFGSAGAIRLNSPIVQMASSR